MTILNPDHLLEQALRLTELPSGGAPRQADLRRAISASYYAVFRRLAAGAADLIIGINRRNRPAYGLVYRRLDHGILRELCNELTKQTLPQKLRLLLPGGAVSADLQAVAAAAITLQEQRHAADYDPMIKIRRGDARVVVEAAGNALTSFAAMSEDERRTFLTLLLFKPR